VLILQPNSSQINRLIIFNILGGPIFIASPAGGTSIEDVAVASPELIFKQPIDITTGSCSYYLFFLIFDYHLYGSNGLW
jgi:succinyl-CoA synthetase beta subunit